MSSEVQFEDNLEDYKELIPDETKHHLGIYRDIVYKLSEIQEKLEKNFYRVQDKDELKKAVNSGELRVGKYSIIEEENNKYKLVKFSDFFQEEFAEISGLIDEITEDLSNSPYRDYLESLSTAYQNNNFIEPYKNWIQLDNDLKIDFMAFPTEPDREKLFNTMLSFDASLRLLSPDFLDYNEKKYRNYIYNNIKSLPEFSELHSNVTPDKVRGRVDNIIFASGVNSLLNFVGQNLPNEREFTERWGSKILIYKSRIEKVVKEKYMPTIQDYTTFTTDYEKISDGFSRLVLAHEISEPFTKFAGIEERLGKYNHQIRELNADLTGTKNYVLQLIKTKDNPDDIIKNISVSYVINSLNVVKSNYSRSVPSPHGKGHVYMLNYMLEKDALEIVDGTLNIHPKKVFDCMSDRADKTLSLLIEGKTEDVEEFFEGYQDSKPFEELMNLS